jgi:hypothetical protein
MSERTDLFTAIGLVLQRMHELADEVGRPGAYGDEVRKEVEALGKEWHALMDRLSLLPGRNNEAKREQS